jgi:class 3 adenylate cyclase
LAAADLTASAAAEQGPATVGATAVPAPASERRYVTVLFADLVGFTPLSEANDPEEMRELLSRYFEVAREVIDGYGGAVEKFIGDAVMAIWGAPVAQEDDAERAVRAALDLVNRVKGLAVGGQQLSLRAGVVSGEAAVTPGRTGQGMVAGDVVNTASRLQSVAPTGGRAGQRIDPPFDQCGHRVRAGRRAVAQGKGDSRRRLAGAPCRGACRGRRPGGGPRAAVRRS